MLDIYVSSHVVRAVAEPPTNNKESAWADGPYVRERMADSESRREACRRRKTSCRRRYICSINNRQHRGLDACRFVRGGRAALPWRDARVNPPHRRHARTPRISVHHCDVYATTLRAARITYAHARHTVHGDSCSAWRPRIDGSVTRSGYYFCLCLPLAVRFRRFIKRVRAGRERRSSGHHSFWGRNGRCL